MFYKIFYVLFYEISKLPSMRGVGGVFVRKLEVGSNAELLLKALKKRKTSFSIVEGNGLAEFLLLAKIVTTQ